MTVYAKTFTKNEYEVSTSANVPMMCDGPAPAPMNSVVDEVRPDHDGTWYKS